MNERRVTNNPYILWQMVLTKSKLSYWIILIADSGYRCCSITSSLQNVKIKIISWRKANLALFQSTATGQRLFRGACPLPMWINSFKNNRKGLIFNFFAVGDTTHRRRLLEFFSGMAVHLKKNKIIPRSLGSSLSKMSNN